MRRVTPEFLMTFCNALFLTWVLFLDSDQNQIDFKFTTRQETTKKNTEAAYQADDSCRSRAGISTSYSTTRRHTLLQK